MDNVLDRRVFLVGFFLWGVEWDLKGRNPFEKLRKLPHEKGRNLAREDRYLKSLSPGPDCRC